MVKNEIVIYQPENGEFRIEVRLEKDTVWLTQAQIAELFAKSISVISRHINNVFKEHELDKKSNLHFLQIANSDKPIKLYSLDVIISVGYRVKSTRGTQFRKWANQIIRNHFFHRNSELKRLECLEQRVSRTEEKIDFFINTSLPPIEGVFFQGEIFEAWKFVSDLKDI